MKLFPVNLVIVVFNIILGSIFTINGQPYFIIQILFGCIWIIPTYWIYEREKQFQPNVSQEKKN